MNAYVETNFVLELSLVQEQHAACERILGLCESGSVRIVIPAYSIVEPYETLLRRHGERKRVRTDVEGELKQLSRTSTYSGRLQGFREITGLLLDSETDEIQRLESARTRLLACAEVIPLDNAVLRNATRYQAAHGLRPKDALVYASVIEHLDSSSSPASCFVTRDSDFKDPDLKEELRARHCTLLSRFDDASSYIESVLAQGGAGHDG